MVPRDPVRSGCPTGLRRPAMAGSPAVGSQPPRTTGRGASTHARRHRKPGDDRPVSSPPRVLCCGPGELSPPTSAANAGGGGRASGCPRTDLADQRVGGGGIVVGDWNHFASSLGVATAFRATSSAARGTPSRSVSFRAPGSLQYDRVEHLSPTLTSEEPSSALTSERQLALSRRAVAVCKAENPCFLSLVVDGLRTVVRPHPGNRLSDRNPRQRRYTRQHRTGAAHSAATTDLDGLSGSRRINASRIASSASASSSGRPKSGQATYRYGHNGCRPVAARSRALPAPGAVETTPLATCLQPLMSPPHEEGT